MLLKHALCAVGRSIGPDRVLPIPGGPKIRVGGKGSCRVMNGSICSLTLFWPKKSMVFLLLFQGAVCCDSE